MPLNIGNVGGSRVQVLSEQVELQWLIFDLLGLRTGVGAGLGVGFKCLWLEEALDLLHCLPWLSSLLSGGGASGLRLESS